MISPLPLLLFTLLFSTSSFAEDQYVSPEWQNLLHYQSGLTGMTSDVDDPDFFIAKDGKSNPQQEFAENIFKQIK